MTAIAVKKDSTTNIFSHLGKLENIYAKHPITSEMLPILVLDNSEIEESSIMLVPAHIQEHYKQVLLNYIIIFMQHIKE